MGVAGANMQWGRFVCPSCSQKREEIALEYWGLLSLGKQAARSSNLCWKRGQVWGTESEQWPRYLSKDVSVGNGKNFEKQAQCSKG